MYSNYERLLALTSKSYILDEVAEILSWDELVMMPPAAAGLRAVEIGVISETSHELFTADEIGNLLEKLKTESLSPEQQANVREIGIDYMQAKRVPASLVREMAEHASASHHAWDAAKKNNDFSAWMPYLKETINLQRKKAACIDPTKDAYEVLFNEYEYDLSIEEMARFLAQMRDALVPLLKSITQKPQIDDAILLLPISKDQQWACAQKVVELMGYDFTKGRLDKSAHPFSAAFGRITTRFDPRWTDILGSSIHELGHATYEHNLPEEYFGTPLGQAVSLGMHESQSRLWENHIGMSQEFWEFMLPHLKTILAPHIDGLTAQQLYLVVNKVEPGLIRVAADELTYTLHIIIRFEIEQQLISGSLAVEDLPVEWNRKYREYLGVTIPSDAQGCMQDVHWTDSFGYFPTYSLGNMIAAQLYDALLKEYPDLMEQVRRGEFGPLRAWLLENIHKHGRRYSMRDLVRNATGEELHSNAYIKYLSQKFSALYGISQLQE